MSVRVSLETACACVCVPASVCVCVCVCRTYVRPYMCSCACEGERRVVLVAGAVLYSCPTNECFLSEMLCQLCSSCALDPWIPLTIVELLRNFPAYSHYYAAAMDSSINQRLL